MSPLQSAGTHSARRPRKVTPARWAAWRTLRRTFDEQAWTDRAFAAIAAELELDPRERAFAQRLTYGAVQGAKRLDHVISTVGKRPLTKVEPAVLHALRIGAYELLELQGSGGAGIFPGGSSAHAAVDQAVELVRGATGERAVAFANAVLRRTQVDGQAILDQLDPDVDAELAVLLSMPEWLVTRLRRSHGERGVAALATQSVASTIGAPFRVNTAHPDAERIDELLAGSGAVAHHQLTTARVMRGATAPLTQHVEAGLLVPQSIASQLVVHALEPQRGERVLDMCAAPGGKTTHVAALLDGQGSVHAVELHEHRASSVRELAILTGTEDLVTVEVRDATTLEPDELGTFDRVLVDAPCSGTGVLGRRPDARWKRTPEDIDELVALQSQLLERAAAMVRPGGVVLYATCSLLEEEDEQVAQRAPASLVPDPVPAGLAPLLDIDGDSPNHARTWPQEHGTDGFFVARFRREP